MEIAFILNALHGLRLVKVFKALVSVELHTATAQRRGGGGGVRQAIRPDIALRASSSRCRSPRPGSSPRGPFAAKGIPVNFTLGFSARQNYLAARFASPSYVNVFLGRLNAYVSDNALGDGLMVGEKATLASQAAVIRGSKNNKQRTRQIAASMRGGSQARDLAGGGRHDNARGDRRGGALVARREMGEQGAPGLHGEPCPRG